MRSVVMAQLLHDAEIVIRAGDPHAPPIDKSDEGNSAAGADAASARLGGFGPTALFAKAGGGLGGLRRLILRGRVLG